MTKLRAIIAALVLVASAGAAQAQSACGYIIADAKLTPAEWNLCFSRKQDALGFTALNRAGDTMTGRLNLTPGSTSSASLRVPLGAAPTSPTDGDVWTTVTGVFVRINGVTQQLVPNTGSTITNPTITGGTINNAVIGGGTPAAGTFTSLISTSGALNGTLGATTPATATVTALTAAQQVVFTGRTDATIAADQNNWTPTGTGTYSTSSAVFVDGGVADRNITGLTGGAAGRFVWLVNKGTTNSIVLKNASGSSTSANQFLLAADTQLPPNTALELRYDGTASNWRPANRALSNTGVTAGSYGDSSHVSQVTVGADGRVSSAASVAISVNAGVVKAKINKFVANGTYTPTTGLLFVIAECVGSGGAGGAASSAASNVHGAGGGGSGAYSRVYLTAAAVGGSQAVTVGVAGVGGSGNGGAGNASSLGALCTANGGAGGAANLNGASLPAGGTGGTVGTGDFTAPGNAGGYGFYGPGLTIATSSSGFGGAGPFGGETAGVAQTGGSGATGNTGTGCGSGGSGAYSNQLASTANGGSGAAGCVIVTEYLNQ